MDSVTSFVTSELASPSDRNLRVEYTVGVALVERRIISLDDYRNSGPVAPFAKVKTRENIMHQGLG